MNESGAPASPRQRSRHWVYLSLSVIVGGWGYRLFTLSSAPNYASWSLGHLFQMALLGTAVTWTVILLLLKIEGEGLSHLGFGRDKLRKSLLPGVLFGLGCLALNLFVLTPIGHWVFPGSESPDLKHWFRGWPAVFVWLFVAVVGGGLNEEGRRSFILTRFEKAFGRIGLIVALFVQAAFFGMNHLYQGKAGAFASGISGLLFGLIYLRRRSCWEAAIAHATEDLIGVGLFIAYVSRH